MRAWILLLSSLTVSEAAVAGIVGTTTDITIIDAPANAANFWIDSSGGTCARQSPAGAYVDAQACGSMGAAYAAALCGDVIMIRNADYSTGAMQDQQILEDVSASACTFNGLTMVGTPITIRGETGTRPKFRHIRFGVDIGACGSNSPDNILITGLDVVWGIDIEHDAHDIVVDDFGGGSFAVGGGYPGCGAEGGPTRVNIRNSEWGPCYTAGGTGTDCRQQYTGAPQEGKNKIVDGVTDMVLEDNIIHDFLITDAAHFECIWSNGGNGVVLRGNFLYNCVTNGIALYSADMAGTWLFENNWWGQNSSGNAALKWGLKDACPSGTVIIRFNSFSATAAIGNEDIALTCTNIYVIGNIQPRVYSCESGAQYYYNLYVGSDRCGTAGNGNILIGALPYVNTNGLASGNYHLSGAPGSTAADNYVPNTVPNSGLTIDYDGEARAAPRDAGADER